MCLDSRACVRTQCGAHCTRTGTVKQAGLGLGHFGDVPPTLVDEAVVLRRCAAEVDAAAGAPIPSPPPFWF